MGLLKNWISGIGKNKKEFKEKFRQAQEEHRIEKLIEEREKSSNERDLENRLERKRQERIKIELDKLRKKDNEEMWKPKINILSSDKMNLLKDDRPILKEKNIFMENEKTRIPFTRGGENQFFKW